MIDGQSISVVLSFCNEEEVIPDLIDRLHKAIRPLKMGYEFIFVNDASTDDSLNILQKRAHEDGHIKIINMSRNFGVSQCTVAGIRHSKGSAVVMMDTDLQDPPEVIPELVEKWLEGADVVYTTRLSREGESAMKLWVTKWAYRVLRFTSEMDLPVDSGDFKLMSRRVVNELIKLNEKDPFLRGLVTWVGFKQVPVYYRRADRFAGKTHFRFYGRKAVWNFFSGLTSFSLFPLHASLALGFLVSFGAFVYLIAIVWMNYLGWNIPGWSAIMATMLFLGGTQLLTIGVLGLYLGRVFNDVKNRPNYIIESMIGFEDSPSTVEDTVSTGRSSERTLRRV
ncbi:glycosyltransferase family 2 protein [Acidobacteria bacterium AH-259-A15]|nr:glycosyltransferase family 2 protein [Acidobacteria bacterium AH-259-A15]